jgi:transposase-like protein
MPGRHGQYPPELRERAVRLVAECRPDHASEWEAMRSVAQKLGIGTTETVRKWVRRAEVDLARARTDLALLNNEVPIEISRADLTAVLGEMSLLVSRLSAASAETKAGLYGDLGVRLGYHHDSGELAAEVNTAEACAKRGVRGGT